MTDRGEVARQPCQPHVGLYQRIAAAQDDLGNGFVLPDVVEYSFPRKASGTRTGKGVTVAGNFSPISLTSSLMSKACSHKSWSS